MFIANNVIKYHLQNVYFVSGGACGGKTTVTNYLAKKYGMVLYNWDEQYPNYANIANSKYQPTMSQRKEITSWEDYFMRPVEEYAEWIETSFQEQTGMAIADLIRIVGSSEGKEVIVDGFFSVEILKEISEYTNVVFLLANPDVVRNDYFNREDKQDMLKCIQGLKHPQAALDNVFHTLNYQAEKKEKEIRESGFKYFVRETINTDPMVLIKKVEKHFKQGGLSKVKNSEI